MTNPSRSIRLRLILAALLTILLAMTAAGWGLLMLFEHHVERRTVGVLQDDIGALIAGVTVGDDGAVKLAHRPTDPRYLKPLSGTYWQVLAQDKVVQRSRSLWDEALPVPRKPPKDGQQEHIVSGPQAQSLIAVERTINVSRAAGNMQIRFVAAQDRAEIVSAVASFRRELISMLTLLGIALLTAFAIAIALGLAPLRHLQANLTALRSGVTKRLQGSYPSEVAVLANDLNSLLDDRDRDAERKRERAANLAHGLKTPLTAIGGICEDLKTEGLSELADELNAYSASMLRHVERELALARSVHTGPGVPPTRVRPVVEALVRSLARVPGGSRLDWEIDLPETVALRIDPTALAEMLGGPMDNAQKFARSSVTVQASTAPGRVLITITDDGPGVAQDDIPNLTQRGQRLDQHKPGSGLGLAITSDIASAVGGTLALENSASGGLLVTLDLPTDRQA